MCDKQEVRMSDMRHEGECRRIVAKVASLIAGAADGKAPSNRHFRVVRAEPCGSYNSFGDQRCALLTMKSRKTWTRATVFNSSG